MKKIYITLALVICTLCVSAQYQIPQYMRKIQYVLGAIDNLYVDTVNMDMVVEGAIENVLKELDPHSVYIPKKEVQRANEPLEGSFEGVGIQFQMLEDTLFVVQTISGCPAERVGIRAGDRIVEIEDSIIAGVKIQNSDIMRKLRGKKGTIVRVKVLRGDVRELIEFTITRDKIPIYSLDAAYMIENTIGYIKINNFGATTLDEFKASFNKLQKQGLQSLVLDLQGNGGGYLNAAIDLSDEFLSKNKLLVYTQGEHQQRIAASSTAVGNFEKGKLVVLVDETSASASEIVSGAVQDWDRGVVVGRRTFGKGLVQRQLMLPDSSAMRLTIARYYTPSGRCIQKPYKGVDYQKDLIERYNHGELMHVDSIQFHDSLKCETLSSKRIVYGGGGIMPDVFVPIDTTRYTDYHRKIVAKGLVNKYCVQYIDKNRNSLQKKYPDFASYAKAFVVTDTMLDELINLALDEQIEKDEEQFERSSAFIRLQLKALIARDLWTMQEYFEIINEENESLKKAIEILLDEEQYNRILSSSSKE